MSIAQYAKINATAAEANRRRGLSQLVGTPKQVAYAESIRADFVDALRLSDERARVVCRMCVVAGEWIEIRQQCFEPQLMAEVLCELKSEIECNHKAGLPCIESVDADSIWRIEIHRAGLRRGGDSLGIASHAVLAAMSALKTESDWEPFMELSLEAFFALWSNQAALDAYLRFYFGPDEKLVGEV